MERFEGIVFDSELCYGEWVMVGKVRELGNWLLKTDWGIEYKWERKGVRQIWFTAICVRGIEERDGSEGEGVGEFSFESWLCYKDRIKGGKGKNWCGELCIDIRLC